MQSREPHVRKQNGFWIKATNVLRLLFFLPMDDSLCRVNELSSGRPAWGGSERRAESNVAPPPCIVSSQTLCSCLLPSTYHVPLSVDYRPFHLTCTVLKSIRDRQEKRKQEYERTRCFPPLCTSKIKSKCREKDSMSREKRRNVNNNVDV